MRGRSFLVLLSQKRAARKKTESVPQVLLQVCRPPFRCFFASKMIDNATIRIKSPCDWRRAILWQDDPASAQSRADSIPHPFPSWRAVWQKDYPATFEGRGRIASSG